MDNHNNILYHFLHHKHLIPNPSIGAFLSGRYEKCDENCEATITMELDFADLTYYYLVQ